MNVCWFRVLAMFGKGTWVHLAMTKLRQICKSTHCAQIIRKPLHILKLSRITNKRPIQWMEAVLYELVEMFMMSYRNRNYLSLSLWLPLLDCSPSLVCTIGNQKVHISRPKYSHYSQMGDGRVCDFLIDPTKREIIPGGPRRYIDRTLISATQQLEVAWTPPLW